MSLPGFTAEASLGRSRRTYRMGYPYSSSIESRNGIPASVLPTQLETMEGEEIDMDIEDSDIEGEEVPIEEEEVLVDGEDIEATGEV